MTAYEVSDVVAALRTELTAGEPDDEFDIRINDDTGAIECGSQCGAQGGPSVI